VQKVDLNNFTESLHVVQDVGENGLQIKAIGSIDNFPLISGTEQSVL